MKGEPIEYIYNTSLKWTDEKRGLLSCKNKPDIEVACPPEFGGHEGFWSPEDLFVSSVEVCTMTTFLWFIKKRNISLKSYKSNAIGKVKMKNKKFQFVTINVDLKVVLSKEEDKKKVENIIKKIHDTCLISNSINTDISIKPEIIVKK